MLQILNINNFVHTSNKYLHYTSEKKQKSEVGTGTTINLKNNIKERAAVALYCQENNDHQQHKK